MNNTLTRNENRLTIEDIKNLYTSGIKASNDMKIGIEYERLPIETKTGQAASYYSQNGICEFLREFAKEENWDYITDNLEIIGLKQGHNTITLEPGSQTEFSLEPQKNIRDLELNINKLDEQLKPISQKFGISFLNYGVSPVTTYKNIKLIPKKRYHIMAQYLWGILSDVMMRETAGIQGTFDFTSEDDAIKKFKIANMLSPFMTALFANSPIRGGVDTGYKSFRALSWLNTDNDRCGFCYNFDNDYGFEKYINFVLNAPMLFISRNENNIVINGGINFKEFLGNGFDNIQPDIDDYKLHANLCFPEVRLRNFIEVRNHDCGKKEYIYAMLAIYKGILYNSDATEKIEELFKNTSYNDFAELRYAVPRLATKSKFKNHTVNDYIKDIIKIAEAGLTENKNGEEKYLEPIKQLAADGICPADIILKNWYGQWNKDISKLLDYITK